MTSAKERVLWHEKRLNAVGMKTVGGKRDWQARGIAIDTRLLCDGDMFVALRGARQDGHAYIQHAHEKGSPVALVSLESVDIPSSMASILVDDCEDALRAMASYARTQSQRVICAVTGSVGKTTTKELIATALSCQADVHKSTGNYNNALGVSIALACLPVDGGYGVFECGMNHKGEIETLSRWLRPDIAVITHIREAHSAFFSSMEDICDAKAEIFSSTRHDGWAVLNRDDAFYERLEGKARDRGISNIMSFGKHKDATMRLLSYERSTGRGRLCYRGETPLSFSLNMMGEHNAMNMLIALCVVKICGLSMTKALAALATHEALEGRGMVLEIPLPEGGSVTLLDESYNASPASMAVALQTLTDIDSKKPKGRRIAVLGDMDELAEPRMRHEELAHVIAKLAIDAVVCCGTWMAYCASMLPTEKRYAYVDNVHRAGDTLCAFVRDGDVVMIKGSASQNMGTIRDRLYALNRGVGEDGALRQRGRTT
ncbi:MAG: UDP-N-acetylmuramoyl-tripeptide--D-alanyl-D-alanine ligase [Alphaproteobacteria bacterium GM7ARS4]|nr:UDP-N-acetylmuramoyl-tripeptide--D-alanyl-D-alanine ligase [Alphaproteobacteria bacterium GM7ARS4]